MRAPPFVCALFSALMTFWVQLASAETILPTEPIEDAQTGQTIGFRTTEPSVYFLLPRQWSSRLTTEGRSAFLSTPDEGHVDIRFALAADYSSAAPSVQEMRAADPAALFFPLPRVSESLTLFLPPALGTIEARLEPDSGLQNIPMGYYRIRLSTAQLRTLVALAHGGLTLTGAATTRYRTGEGEIQSVLPVTVILNPDDLTEPDGTPPLTPAQWLGNLLDTYELRQSGGFDGSYGLGGQVGVTIAHSLITGGFLSKTYQVTQRGGVFATEAMRSPNFAGSLSFVISELGADIQINFSADLALELDARTLVVQVTDLRMRSADVLGQTSPLYRELLNSFLGRPDTQQRISAALTRELQRRILSQTLFGIEEDFQ